MATDDIQGTDRSDGVSFMLGRLQQGMEMVLKTLSEDRTAAAQYRTEIRTEIGVLHADYQEVRSDLKAVKEKIEKIEPTVDRLDQKDHRDQGAKTLAISIGSFLGKAAQFGIGLLGGIGAIVAQRLLHK